MAEGRNFNISIILGVVDKASAELDKFNKNIQDQKEGIEDTGKAMVGFGATITAALGLAVRAAGEQELAFARLERSVELSGNSYQESKGSIDAYIDSMQQMTVYGDDQTAQMLKGLLVYTKDLDEAMMGAKIAADMTSSGMYGMEQATKLVGMAMNGNVEMLGRMIPELKTNNNVLLDNMSSAEKAEYALNLLQQKFGGMSDVELKTLPGQVKQLGNYFGDLTEDIGDKALPAIKDFTGSALATVNTLREWIKEHPVLSQTLISTAGYVGVLSTAFGTLLLAGPKLVDMFTTITKFIVANPYIAAAAGIALLVTATMSYISAQQQEAQSHINTGKTLQDKIALMEQAKQKYKEIATDADASAEEQKAALNNYMSALTAQKQYEKQLEDQRRAEKKSARDQDAIEEYNAMIEQNRLKLQELDLYYQTADEYQARLQEAHAAKLEQMKLTWSGAWQVMSLDAIKYSINWYDKITSLQSGLQTAMTTGFAEAFKHIGEGWDNLKDIGQRMMEGMRDAIINSIADIAAEWIIKHGIMAAATKVWAVAEIAWNAAVAGAKAVAASAWALWGSIAIGAAIMASVMGFMPQFANGGIVGGNSYTGDHMMVRANSGELILNDRQQAELWAMANGRSSGGGNGIVVQITGNYLLDQASIDGLAESVGDSIFRAVQNERSV